MGIFKQFGFSLSGRQKAELLEVEAILAASTFIFPYKIHVPMLVVWGSECLYLNFRSQNTCRSHKIWQKKAHSWVQHKNQSKIKVKQVKIPGYTRTRAGVDDSTFFLRERGLSSGTQNHAIAEGRGLLEVEILLYLVLYTIYLFLIILYYYSGPGPGKAKYRVKPRKKQGKKQGKIYKKPCKKPPFPEFNKYILYSISLISNFPSIPRGWWNPNVTPLYILYNVVRVLYCTGIYGSLYIIARQIRVYSFISLKVCLFRIFRASPAAIWRA